MREVSEYKYMMDAMTLRKKVWQLEAEIERLTGNCKTNADRVRRMTNDELVHWLIAVQSMRKTAEQWSNWLQTDCRTE